MTKDKGLESNADIFEKLPTLKRTAEQVFTVDDLREKIEVEETTADQVWG